MKVLINGNEYEVVIEKKNIKNTYIRVKDDLKIHVSTNVLTSENYIENLINNNLSYINKMLNRESKKLLKASKFYYLGREYQVIIVSDLKKPVIEDKYFYIKSKEETEKFLIKEAKTFLPERVKVVYEKMGNNKIPFPKITIKKMVRKWGYCNKSTKTICLNRELIKYDIDDIDYVIVHELCHFLHFDHSKAFWDSVKLYKPNYKENKKHLKED